MQSPLPLIALLLIFLLSMSQASIYPGEMDGIATGSIVLSGNDIGSSPFKNYTVPLGKSLGKNLINQVGYAFGLTSFQAAGGQTNYSVFLRFISLDYNQTIMNLSIYFYNSIEAFRTQWMKLKWTYLLVSSTFDGEYTNIWTTFTEVKPLTQEKQPVHLYGLAFLVKGGINEDCDVYVSPLMQVDGTGCTPVPANSQYTGGKIIIHAYVSGFSVQMGNTSKKVSVTKGNSESSRSDSLGWEIKYSTTYPNGPLVVVSGGVSQIQISFVYVRMDYYSLDYPFNSKLQYSSAHIFTEVEGYDSEISLQHGQLGSYNENYYELPDTVYQIYGLSAFTLNSNTELVSVEVELDRLKYKVKAPLGSVSNVIISGDLFISNIKYLCSSKTESQLQGQCKKLAVSPNSTILSVIDVTNNIPYSKLTKSQKPIILKHGIASSTQNLKATFSSQVEFTGITPQQTAKVQMRFFEAFGSPSLVQNGQYIISVSVNGIKVLEHKYIHHISVNQYMSPPFFRAIKSTSTAVNIQATVQFNSQVASQELYLLIAAYSESAVYNPTSHQCQAQCPQNYGIKADKLPLICLKCDSNPAMTYSILEGKCVCPIGNYLNKGVCSSCGSGCATCDPQNPNFCLSCSGSDVLTAGSCVSTNCPAGTVALLNSLQCLPCEYPCKRCITYQYYCTSCQNNFYLYKASPESQTCLSVCPLGTLLQGNTCRPCEDHCSACSQYPSKCIRCQHNYFLYKFKCLDHCPGIKWSGDEGALCLDHCPQGLFSDGKGTCLACAPQCLTCDVLPSNCTSCRSGVLAQYGVCVNNCLDNQFISGGLCFNCSFPCTKCFKTNNYCVGCPNDMVVLNGKCVKECPSGYFYKLETMNCSACGKGCSVCEDQKHCLTCLNQTYLPLEGFCPYCQDQCFICGPYSRCLECPFGLNLFNGACREHCPLLTIPINGRCICLQGILQHDQCLSTCDSGFYYERGVCLICSSDCLQCSSYQKCTKCFYGFKLQQENCVQTNVCYYGAQYKGGKCQKLCKDGQYFFEGRCIFGGCLNGYQPNSWGGCQRSNIYKCPDHRQYFQGQCLESCGLGFFSFNFRCIPCPSHCDACASRSHCFNCSADYTNIDGQCYYSKCGNGSVAVGSECKSQCPTGTVERNKVCIRRCSEFTYYSDPFCYFSCPSDENDQFACLA